MKTRALQLLKAEDARRYIRAFLGKLSHLPAFKRLNRNVLHVIARPQARNVATDSIAFIVGAPRSGSTLLYQLLTTCFEFGYMSNVHCLLYGAPHWIERLLRIPSRLPKVDFKSNCGQTYGVTGPSECHAFWDLFFPGLPSYLEVKDVPAENLQRLRDYVRAFVESAGKPIVVKNPALSMRLLPLAHALPEAVFLVTERDEVDNAHSVLHSQWQRNRNYAQWIFHDTPNMEQLRQLPLHEQAIEYVRTNRMIIERQSRQIGETRFYWVSYEQLCSSPRSVLNEISRFLAQNGFRCRERPMELPKHFERRKTVRIDSELYDKMMRYARLRLKTDTKPILSTIQR